VIKGRSIRRHAALSKRAFTLAGYPFYSVGPCLERRPTPKTSFGGRLVPAVFARGAHGLMVEMVHNDVSAAAKRRGAHCLSKRPIGATLRAAGATS